MSRSRIPPLLQPYTLLTAPDSLILLTSVLGASANWLLIRFLCGALNKAESAEGWRSAGSADDVGGVADRGNNGVARDAGEGGNEVVVVFVSWLRDWEFWRNEAKRNGGLDLARLAQQRRFVFVDGLTNLVASSTETPSAPTGSSAQPPFQRQQLQRSPLYMRPGHTIAPQNPRVSNPGLSPQESTAAAPQTQPAFRFTSTQLQHMEDVVQRAVEHVQRPSEGRERPKKVLLVLDSPDLLLALSPSALPSRPSASSSPNITAASLNASILQLRQLVHSTVITVAADTPLISTSSSSTPLETNHAAFLIHLAHVASYSMSLRLLDTGFAADVSGVLRITKGEAEAEPESGGDNLVEKEMLYSVGGDGTVKVFERGAASAIG